MLTDATIKTLKPKTSRYLTTDGRGLSLDVLPSGVKTWIFRYRLNGTQEKITMGQYPDLSLAFARKERDRLAVKVAAGKSPANEKKQARGARLTNPTVREFCERYYSEQTGDMKQPSEISRYIDREIVPAIGNKLLRDVAVTDVQRMLYRKRDQGHVTTALHLRGILKRIFDYAVEVDLMSSNPAQLVKAKFIGKTKPRTRALSPAEIRSVLRTIDQADILDQFKLTFRIVLATMVRKGELLQARWEDVDLEAGLWTIPGHCTKTGKPHLVYLSTQVSEMFRELKLLACGSELVLPGRDSLRRPICASTVNNAFARLTFDVDGWTIHDMRRTSSTLLHGNGFNSDAIELALGHAIGGVRGIYNVQQYGAERKKMLQWWADYLDSIVTGAKVVVGHFGT